MPNTKRRSIPQLRECSRILHWLGMRLMERSDREWCAQDGPGSDDMGDIPPVEPAHQSWQAPLDFLRSWAPNGLWALTSIVPDAKTQTMTFGENNVEAMLLWISGEQDNARNIYYHVNQPAH